jgi:hypothetical protein
MFDKLAESNRNYEKTSQFLSKIISYGTAGFRMKYKYLKREKKTRRELRNNYY